MTFYERCMNFFYGMLSQYAYYNRHIPAQDKIMKSFFGQNVPDLRELIRNTSLVLVNHHHSMSFPRPYLPNMIEIGGYHVNPPKPLPKVRISYLLNISIGLKILLTLLLLLLLGRIFKNIWTSPKMASFYFPWVRI